MSIATALKYPTTTTTIFLLFVLALFLCTCSATGIGYLCNEDRSGNSKISANIDRLIPELVSHASSSGYFAATTGDGYDKMYGLAQCRGDVGKADCSSCLNEAAEDIRGACRNQPDSRIWYDYCFLRYNLDNFIGKVDISFGYLFVNVKNVTGDPENFNKQVSSVMDKLKSTAVVAKSKGLAKIETKLSRSVTLYALVHCTGDIDEVDCTKCVTKALAHFPKYCTNRRGCKVLYSNCYVRYELYPFFFPLSSNSSASSVGSTFVVLLED